MKVAFFAAFAATSIYTAAFADCVDVIRASLTVRTAVAADNEIISSARDFCQSYTRAKTEGTSFSGGVSYGVLSADAGGTRLSVDEVAQKYCDASNSSQVRSSAYEQYIETIAPGAYSSYDNCIKSSTDLKASLNPNGILPGSLVITVHNENNDVNNTDSFQANPSPNITCTWAPSDRAKVEEDVVSLPGRSSAALRCLRKNPEERAYITLATTTSPDEAFTFAWTAFQNERPVDQMLAIRQEVEQAKRITDSFIESTRNSIIAFRGPSCPNGWQEATDIAGRTIIGSGSGSGLTTRAVGETGGSETHTLSVAELPPHSHKLQMSSIQDGRGTYEGPMVVGRGERLETGSAGSGGAHNNMPPFISLIYCTQRS